MVFLYKFSCFAAGLLSLSSVVKAIDVVSYDADDYGQDDDTPYQRYLSAPNLKPPEMLVTTLEDGIADGFVFIGTDGAPSSNQRAPVILDMSAKGSRMGSLVWTDNSYNETFGFMTQKYKGKPVLTFWSGEMLDGYGMGTYYILNQSYVEIANFSPVGVKDGGDIHEFYITENNTALVTMYVKKQIDLTSLGGDDDGWVLDGHFQEIDIATNELIFSWKASDYIPVNETYNTMNNTGSKDSPFDWFHINSLQKDSAGDYLISARVMDCVYKISGDDGSIKWKLNGKDSDFDVDDSANFAYQHHARWVDDPDQTRMTVFDNGPTDEVDYSRGLLMAVDQDNMTVTTITEFTNGDKTFAEYEGNLIPINASDIENTNWFLGFGNQPYFTELDKDGNIVMDVEWGVTNAVNSYRAFKQKWVGKPTTNPSIYYSAKNTTVYVSWNGATEHEKWVIYTADKANSSDWTKLNTTARTGFETAIDLSKSADKIKKLVRAKAIDADGNKLGWSNATDGTDYYISDYDSGSKSSDSSSSSTASSSASGTVAAASSTKTGAAPTLTYSLRVLFTSMVSWCIWMMY
ncbi:MAG: hypothetical protein M1834_002011 [Cirrosporium novae-zelandiae]|nr:MAG: hypothetical protein M1834_002011 [Cirrosporium novae-zelandiae]